MNLKMTTGALVLSLFAVSVASAAPPASQAAAPPTQENSSVDAPLFRHVFDCSVEMNPILGYVGVGTLTTAQFGAESHVASIVPAPPLTPQGRAGFYVLSDRNQAVFIDVPVYANDEMKWAESGPFSKKADAITRARIFSDEDVLNGHFGVSLNLACTGNFEFKDPEGHPLRMLMDPETGAVFPKGVPVTGTCGNLPTSQGVAEVPKIKKFGLGQIDRGVAGPEVDKAAIEDFHIRLSDAMARVIENVRNPEAFKRKYPYAEGAGNIGTKGAGPRKNACHLLNTFFKSYNECASRSLRGAGGLGEMSQKDPEFHQRLVSLGKLYASFREPSDGAECKPPVAGPASEQGGLSSRAAP